MTTQPQSFSPSEAKSTATKTSLAESQEKCYLRNKPNDDRTNEGRIDVRTLRNRVRGKLENADLSDPATVVLLEATARMWHLTK